MNEFDPVALWGAFLSSVLAGVKLYEFWRDRRRLDCSYNFTGDENIGNEIIIRNLSLTPLIITHWELVWKSRKWWKLQRKQKKRIAPDFDFSDSIIKPHSTLTLKFNRENYFSWSPKALGDSHIYLTLQIAGEKRSRSKRIYSN
jgi:hypothetical protein